MQVLVYQSHPTVVAPWIERCTETVRTWTAARGYSYRLLGDELFDGQPPELLKKVQSRLPLTDLGRLLWAQRLLRSHDVVIWIDADVVVFKSEAFEIDVGAPELVCREIGVRRARVGMPAVAYTRFNPTVLLFSNRSTLLKRWLARIEKEIARWDVLPDPQFGSRILEDKTLRKRVASIDTVAHLNKPVLEEVQRGVDGPNLRCMRAASESVFGAANLCGHHKMPAGMYLEVIERLVATSGAILSPREQDGLAAG